MRTKLITLLLALLISPLSRAQPPARPNILWIVSEDNNPYLGCYGDAIARTPTIDSLAVKGILYENCFSQAPVCAPSRFTLISGMYATSCAPANHMRASGKPPAELRGFPAYLRAAGYYTTNNAKTDYNAPIDMKDAWDESSKKAHWRNRKPGQPFFAVFNHEVTHESSIHGKQVPLPNGTDPASVRIPAYTPDTPETRADRALYYDNMRRLDGQVARLLQQIDEDGLTEDTIVFYYGDNGGILPRSKRFCYDSGLHVPLIVRFPKKWQQLAGVEPGSRVKAPVSFVDFAPTILSLAGVDAPKYFQGQAFLGPKKGPDQEFAFGFRNRMDERYDFVRTARDARYRYIRNYNPHFPDGQHVQYLWQQKGMPVWENLFKAGKLNDVQKAFWLDKPSEMLFDLQTDPDEVKNLVDSPEHKEILARLRQALRDHMLRTRDNGFIPEGCAAEGFANSRDDKAYPLQRIMDAADLATGRDLSNVPKFIEAMKDPNEIIRYWGAMGCLMLRGDSMPAKDALIAIATNDPVPQVRVPAAETLVWIAHSTRRSRDPSAPALPPAPPARLDQALAGQGLSALTTLLADPSNRVRLQSANALDHLGHFAKPALPALQKAAKDKDDYVARAARYTAAILAGEPAPTEPEQ